MRIGPIFRLFEFFAGARDYARPESEALKQLEAEAPRHQAFHRVIVACGVLGMVLGLIGGILGAIASSKSPAAGNRPDDTFIVYLMPILTAAAGMLGGAAWACGLAPASFLNGPLGAKWLKLVGTRNVAVSRVISLTVAVLGTGFCIAMMVLRDKNP
jgi:hypothetical protein